MKREPDFHELVGDDLPAAEAERLRRVHDQLLEAGPPPELTPSLAVPATGRGERREREGTVRLLPRRRAGAALALAAAIALIAFFGGYLAGYRHHGFAAKFAPAMHGVGGAQASAVIKVGARDSDGNWPLQLEVTGLPRLKSGYYEMFLTRGRQRLSCGTFAVGGPENVTVRMTIPYELRRGDGWIVTAEQPRAAQAGRTVLTT